MSQENIEDDVTGSISDIDFSSDDETSSQKFISDERGHSFATYESLVAKTRDIPLEKVSNLKTHYIPRDEIDLYYSVIVYQYKV